MMVNTVQSTGDGLDTSITEESVPRNVVEGSLERKLRFFDSQFVRHPSADLALKQLLDSIHHAEPETLVYLIGPGCVGKSALKRAAKKVFFEESKEEIENNEGHFLQVDYEIGVSDIVTDWREVHHGALDAFREQLIGRKIPATRSLAAYLSSNPRHLRMACDSAYRSYLGLLQCWRPVVVFWDSANSLIKIPMQRGPWLLDPLIGMCMLAPHVLIGTPVLMKLRNLSFQVGHRSEYIYFRSYSLSDPIDQGRFAISLRGFEQVLPVQEPPDLVSNIEYLMAGTVGCVGSLKKWLRAALRRALIENSATVRITHLEATQPNNGLLREAAMEITEFERALLQHERGELQCAMTGLYAVERERMESVAIKSNLHAPRRPAAQTESDSPLKRGKR